jgi:hypothetical protein
MIENIPSGPKATNVESRMVDWVMNGTTAARPTFGRMRLHALPLGWTTTTPSKRFVPVSARALDSVVTVVLLSLVKWQDQR